MINYEEIVILFLPFCQPTVQNKAGCRTQEQRVRLRTGFLFISAMHKTLKEKRCQEGSKLAVHKASILPSILVCKWLLYVFIVLYKTKQENVYKRERTKWKWSLYSGSSLEPWNVCSAVIKSHFLQILTTYTVSIFNDNLLFILYLQKCLM